MSENKKIKYVKIKDEDYNSPPPVIEEAVLAPVEKPQKQKKTAKSPKKKHELTTAQKVKKVLAVIATTLLSMMMIVIITVCIVATALTVYVMQFAEDSFDIDLRDVELSYSSYIYAYDSNGEEVELKTLSSDENRIWVDIDTIPQYVLDAFVAMEDQRFYEHEGVDWFRTFSVTVKALFSSGTEGGSTITQQLVRDVTGDKEVNVGRKLREIFRAMSLEKKYTKFDILESYLNRIGFGSTCYGIASAAQYYFDKDVSELTIAEGAILAGVVRSPSNFNPYADLTNCRKRQLDALEKMYNQGFITTQEYESAKSEQVKFRRPVYGDDFGYVDERYNEYYGIQDDTSDDDDDLYYENESWDDIGTAAYTWNGGYEVTQDWYVDAGISQVISDLAQEKGITTASARELLYKGGYSVYLNMDIDIQTKLDEAMKDPYTALSKYDVHAASSDLLQASFVLMDYSGRVVALAGGLGEKPGDNCFNRATQSKRSVGSTIKPIGVYSIALEKNAITYSTMIQDISGKVTDENADWEEYPDAQLDDDEVCIRWPQNYQSTDNGSMVYRPAWYAVMKSMNTISARVLNMIGLQASFDQLTTRLGVELDAKQAMTYSGLATGSAAMTLLELCGAYQIFGNGGVYYEPYLYSKVVDSTGKTILEQNYTGTQAISRDTSWVTNRMMYTVAHDTAGSGRYSLIDGIEVIGKTGTANDESNLHYMGLTPSYVGAVRIGYDDNRAIGKADGWLAVAQIWNRIMTAVTDTSVSENFIPDASVVQVPYCTETGLLATSRCPSTEIGYYRSTNIPRSCDCAHDGKPYFDISEEGSVIPFYGYE